MKCSRCSGKSIIRLKYVGLNLCRSCFVKYFEKRVRKTISEKKMLDNAKCIAVAISGGKDSVTVLHILNKLVKNKKIFAIYIDGGIKGYDDKLLKNAEKACKDNRIKLYVFRFKKEFSHTIDDLAKLRPGTCNCGVFRRYLLNKKSRELGADRIATGHNLDDEVESILMNFIRGDANRIARGAGTTKSDKFIPRIKPLERCPEDEVGLYAKLLYPKMDFSLKCPYRKIVLRNDIKKMIDILEKNHPGIKFQLFESNKKIREILRKSITTDEPPKNCKKCGEITSADVCQACTLKEEIKNFMKKR